MAIRLGGNLGFNKQIGGLNLGINIPFGDQGGNKTEVGDGGKTLDNSHSRIITHVWEGGGHSKPALYRVKITPPNSMSNWENNIAALKHITFNCDSIGIPGRNISTKPFKTYGLKKEYAYEKIHPEIQATFYVSESYDEFRFFEEWTDTIYNANGTLGWYNDYAQSATMEIEQLSNKAQRGEKEDLGVIAKCTVYEAYPKTVSPVQLSYASSNTVQKITVSFAFRDAKTEYPQATKALPKGSRAGLLQRSSSFFDNFRISGLNIPLGRGVGITSVPNRNRSIF